MIDRQTQAVAMALDPIAWQSGELWDFSEHIERRNRSLKQAGTAIAASDAKYVPMLVEALKECRYKAKLYLNSTMHRDSGILNDIDWITEKALSQLPEDLK